RREQHGQAVGPRLRVVQGDRRRDRVAAVPRAHADPYKRLRRRKPLCGWSTAREHWTSCSARIAVRRSAQSRLDRSRAARRSLVSMRYGASARLRITLGALQRTSSVAHNAAAGQSAWAREKGGCLLYSRFYWRF